MSLRMPKLAWVLGLVALSPLVAMPMAWATESGTWSNPADPTVAPGPRREFTAVYDAPRDRYLIFGGFGFVPQPGEVPDPPGYNVYNQVWVLTLDTSPPAWSLLDIPGTVPGQRHSPQWAYDEANQRMIMFGGYGRHYPGLPYEYLNDVWQLSLAGDTPAWTELFPTGTAPSGRLAGASIYDPLRQRFVGFGGTVGMPVDTWELDLAGDPKWSTVDADTTSRPPGGYGMASIYDPKRDRMIIFGGSVSDDYFGVRNDTYVLDLADPPTWHKLAPAGTLPGGRRTMTSIYDATRDRMVIFGGWDAQSDNTTSFLDETWELSLEGSPTWTQLTPAGPLPIGRDATAAVYDPGADRMVVFGGWSGASMLDDTWFLDWGAEPPAPALVASSSATPSMVHVSWNVTNTTGSRAGVYRKGPTGSWQSVGTVETQGAGAWSFDDPAVTAGNRYGYQIVVPSLHGATFGGTVWVDVPGSATGVTPAELSFALRSVAPNPIADRFVASFSLPTAESASLELLDVLGRRVLSRELGVMGAGSHQLELGRAGGIAAGVYFLRLSQGTRTQTTRVAFASR